MDLTTLSRNVTHDFKLPLVDRDDEVVKEGECTLHFNLCITGTRVEEEQEEEESMTVANKYVCANVLLCIIIEVCLAGASSLA